jgi:SAM-dependent methyltransferase
MARPALTPPTGASAGIKIRLACPTCGDALTDDDGSAGCPSCEKTYTRERGIWGLLPAARVQALRGFVRDYELIRRAEGWGSDDPSYFRELPFRDLGGRWSSIWEIRARSFRALIDQVLRPLEEQSPRPLVSVDLGAGNGWLSHRLAQRGHAVAALDLLTNDLDGLGAHRHYPEEFVAVQGDYDRLPFPSSSIDLAIFNASLHYSPDCAATLAESLRVVRTRGAVVVLDTPFYRDAASGARMVAEREHRFLLEHGTASNALRSEGYLTYARLRGIASSLRLVPRLIRTDSRWSRGRALLGAALRGRREPAAFPIVCLRKGAD